MQVQGTPPKAVPSSLFYPTIRYAATRDLSFSCTFLYQLWVLACPPMSRQNRTPEVPQRSGTFRWSRTNSYQNRAWTRSSLNTSVRCLLCTLIVSNCISPRRRQSSIFLESVSSRASSYATFNRSRTKRWRDDVGNPEAAR